MKGRDEHLAEHGNNFDNASTPELFDRTNGGKLPRIRDTNGYAIKQKALAIGATILSGAADAAEFADYFDPLTYITHVGEAGAGSDVVGQPSRTSPE